MNGVRFSPIFNFCEPPRNSATDDIFHSKIVVFILTTLLCSEHNDIGFTFYVVTLFTSLQIQIKFQRKIFILWKNPLQICIYSIEDLTSNMSGNTNF